MMETIERSGEGMDLRILDVSGFDLTKAAPDAITTNAGYGPATPHPLAEDLFDANLATIAAHFGNLVSTTSGRHAMTAISGGMRSLDFSGIVENVGKRVVEKTFQHDDTISRIARPLPKESFQSTYLASVSLVTELESTGENAELPMLIGRVNDNKTPQLKTWSMAIYIQRRDIVNNDQLLIAQLFAEAGQLAQRHEMRQVIEYLESNPTLPELDSKGGADRAWFTEADGNLVNVGITSAGLSAACAAMRNHTAANGDKENIAPKIILCPPDQEHGLRRFVREGDLPLEVVTNANIDPDRYYLLADPARQPAIGVQFIGKPTDRKIKTWSLNSIPKLPATYDGIGYKLHVDMSTVAMSRKGIVRVDLS